MSVWFTSDLHFGHSAIIDHCRRPFSNADEMDAALVDNWNSAVAPGDRVYVLGDVSFRSLGQTIDIVSSLRGQKYLVAGNHDSKLRRKVGFQDLWVWIKDLASIKIEKQHIILCHYALLTWNRMNYGAWHLHGHSHGSLAPNPMAKRLDVGFDAWGFLPLSFDRVERNMREKKFKPVDHHNPTRAEIGEER